MRVFTTLILTVAGIVSTAQNPVVQTYYTTDPAPMVHDDTFYIYTGHDEDGADLTGVYIFRQVRLFLRQAL